jgi:acetyl-CoA C-acetyltransferase
MNPDRLPVIIGTGQVNLRDDDLDTATDAAGLMRDALLAANADAGVDALGACDTLELVRLFSSEMEHIPEFLAALFSGIRNAPQFVAGHGNTPLLLLSRAANRIASGEAEICAIAGAEAYRTEKRLAARAAGSAHNPDTMQKALALRTSEAARRYGLVSPIEIYPLFENAMRAAWGQSLTQAQEESARIWSEFSKVAAANPHAWIRKPLEPADILALGPRNRMLGFPYTTLMVANNSVNQGAAVLVASLGAARRMGIPEDRLVFVGACAAADESHDIRERSDYHSCPSLEASVRIALERNGLAAADCDALELYSCFPCVPKYAQRVVGIAADQPLSVTGGLTFAGGPIRNYMMHTVAAMTEVLRAGAKHGLLFANGGFMTNAHSVVLSSRPTGAELPQSFDVQAQAQALRGPIPDFVDAYEGPARIETYVVMHDRDGRPERATVVARSPQGARMFCTADAGNTQLMELLTSGVSEPVGRSGVVVRGSDGLNAWIAG